jgi:hypothetical protein
MEWKLYCISPQLPKHKFNSLHEAERRVLILLCRLLVTWCPGSDTALGSTPEVVRIRCVIYIVLQLGGDSKETISSN